MPVEITYADLTRIADQLRSGRLFDPREWLAHVGIERETILRIAESARAACFEKAAAGQPVDAIMLDLVVNTFRVGWEAHAEFGRRS
jgi:hypothetical protein